MSDEDIRKRQSVDDMTLQKISSIGESYKAAGIDFPAVSESIIQFYHSAQYEVLTQEVADFREWYEQWMEMELSEFTVEDLKMLEEFIQVFTSDILQYAKKIFREYKENHNTDIITVNDLFDGKESMYSKIKKFSEVELLPKDTHPVSNYVMPNDAISNVLTGYMDRTGKKALTANAGAFELTVINGKGHKKPVTAYTMITVPEGANIDEVDTSIMNSIVTLFDSGNYTMTLDDIYLTTGLVSRARPKSIEDTHNRIDKMRMSLLTSDYTDYVNTWNHNPKRKNNPIVDAEGNLLTEYYINDNILTLTEGIARKRHGTKEYISYCSRGTSPSPLYDLCVRTGTLIRVPLETMSIRETHTDTKGNLTITNSKIYMTEEKKIIREYLVRRVAVMKNAAKNHRKNISNVILFDTIYVQCNVISNEKNKKTDTRRARNFVFDVMDYWKATGYIQDYEKIKNGNKYQSIKIII